jgi:hypothetical protein
MLYWIKMNKNDFYVICMHLCEFIWIYMNLCESRWNDKFMWIYVNLNVNLDGFKCVCMDLNGLKIWILMNLYESKEFVRQGARCSSASGASGSAC